MRILHVTQSPSFEHFYYWYCCCYYLFSYPIAVSSELFSSQPVIFIFWVSNSSLHPTAKGKGRGSKQVPVWWGESQWEHWTGDSIFKPRHIYWQKWSWALIAFRIVFNFLLIKAASCLPWRIICSTFDMKFPNFLYHFCCEEGGGSRGTVPAFGYPIRCPRGPWQHWRASWRDAHVDMWECAWCRVRWLSCSPPPPASSL